jgi:voltage-gated potassium channel
MVLLSALLLSFGTAGYMLIEGWSLIDALYMTVITLATVGYGEVHVTGVAGRIFTIVLIILGVGFCLYVVGNLVQFLVEGQIRLILGRRKLDKQISQLKGHYIVCGYGRMGRGLCRYLSQKQLNFAVIEENPDRTPAMDEDDILYIVGDSTSEANLTRAGIDRASTLMAVLGSDAANVFLVLTARRRNRELFIVARANENETKNTLYAAGANVVVSPYEIGARRMAHAILRPTVIHFLELAFADASADIEMEEIPVHTSSNLVGMTLQESGIRQNLNLIIIAMRKPDGNMHFNPSAGSRIEAGDTVIAVGENQNLIKLEKILNP